MFPIKQLCQPTAIVLFLTPSYTWPSMHVFSTGRGKNHLWWWLISLENNGSGMLKSNMCNHFSPNICCWGTPPFTLDSQLVLLKLVGSANVNLICIATLRPVKCINKTSYIAHYSIKLIKSQV